MTPVFDVVLVGYRSERFLPRLHEDLAAMSTHPYELWYRDNLGNLRSLSGLWNELAAMGKAPYLCVLNPDVALSPGWDAKLIKTLDEPGVGVAIADNPMIGGDFPSRATMDAACGPLKVEKKDTTHTLVGLHFYCPMMRRSTWETLHGVDERLRFYNQDCEFLTRMRTVLGLTVAYARGAVVWHYGGASTGEAERRGEINRKLETYVSQEAWNRIQAGRELPWHLLSAEDKAEIRRRPEYARMGGDSLAHPGRMPVHFVTSKKG